MKRITALFLSILLLMSALPAMASDKTHTPDEFLTITTLVLYTEFGLPYATDETTPSEDLALIVYDYDSRTLSLVFSDGNLFLWRLPGTLELIAMVKVLKSQLEERTIVDGEVLIVSLEALRDFMKDT
jgi:hypothetical protein